MRPARLDHRNTPFNTHRNKGTALILYYSPRLLVDMTIKPFPRFLRTGMPLILASGSLRLLANATSTTDKESEVESIFLKLESDARAFRDKIMQANGARCEANTLEECYQGNFNDCDSSFPNQVCLRAEEFVVPICGDGVSCNGECVHEDI